MTTDNASTHSHLHSNPSRSSFTSSVRSTSHVHHRNSTPAGNHLRVEVYTAVDPYEASISHSIINLYSRENVDSSLEGVEIPEQYSTHQLSMATASVQAGLDEVKSYILSDYILAFIIDTLPRLIYSYLLLRLPSLYFSRVARVFEDADLTMPEIKRMALELANAHSENVHQLLFTSLSNRAPANSPFWALKSSWESFIESLLREWKTLNIISVLLLRFFARFLHGTSPLTQGSSAIMTVFQIDSAASDPLTRYSALSSLVCALMSLLYGCIFIIQFGTMKKPHKAAEWAWEARRMRTVIWWNVWVMLAMPAVWLSWRVLLLQVDKWYKAHRPFRSVVLFIVSMMSFVWRSGSTLDGAISPLDPNSAFWPRLIVSIILSLGIIYFVMITMTLKQYGPNMDKKWRERVRGWTDRLIFEKPFPEHMDMYSHVPHWQPSPRNSISRRASDDSYPKPVIPSATIVSRSPSPINAPHYALQRTSTQIQNVGEREPENPNTLSSLQTFKAIELLFQRVQGAPFPAQLSGRYMSALSWVEFTNEIAKAWDAPSLPTPQASVLRVLSRWNANVFSRLFIEAVLCQEYYQEWPESPIYAIYFTDHQPVLGRALSLEERFGQVPVGLTRIDVLDFSNLQHNWVSLFPPRGTEVHFNITNRSSPVQYRRTPIPQGRGDHYHTDTYVNEIPDLSENGQSEDNRSVEDEVDTPPATNSSIRNQSRRPYTPHSDARSSEQSTPMGD